MEQRITKVQQMHKTIEFENQSKPIETIYLKHFARELPLNSTYSIKTEFKKDLPIFVSQFQDLHVNCGEKAYFEAKIVPQYDPDLRVEWFFNNIKLESNAKISTSINFGLINLTILNVTIEDAGIYLCRVYNKSGEAFSAAALSVTSRKEYSHSIKAEYDQQLGHQVKQHKLIEEKTSQHKIDEESKILLQQHLLQCQRESMIGAEQESRKPTFLSSMQDLVLYEGSNAHFHCRLEPSNDPKMSIEWFLNGKPLISGSRISSIFSCGYVALNIYYLRKEDEGIYTCKVRNLNGETFTEAKLKVIANIKQTFNYDNLSKLHEIERQTNEQCNQINKQLDDLDNQNQKPIFLTQLKDLIGLHEGQTALFEAHLEPQSDPNMVVSWYKNNQPIELGSRISTFFNFGYVSLKIQHLVKIDEGEYTCVAKNNVGQVQSTGKLSIIVNEPSLLTNTNSENSWQQIQHLEDTSKYKRKEEVDIEFNVKPKFLTDLYGKTELNEGQTAHFEAKLEPANDSNLRVEWFKNGESLEQANRISTFFNFGYVSLKISSITNRDDGEYTCVATNKAGTDYVSSRLMVKVKKSIEFDSQFEDGLRKIQHLESSSKYKREEYEDVEINEKPKFITPLEGSANLAEGQPAHFEAKLEPLGDPKMRIEWYFNDRLLSVGHRFKSFYDFGFVALDILYAYPEDSGIFTVRAINDFGEDSVSRQLTVFGRTAIDKTKIFDINVDETRQMRNEKIQNNRDIYEEIRQKPRFITPLNQPKNPHMERVSTHLECRIEHLGDPTLKVEWFFNNKPLQTGSRFSTGYNFGFVSLDLMCLTLKDTGEYTVRISNDLGSISSSAYIEVVAESNVITSSQFPESLEKIHYLEGLNKNKKADIHEEQFNQKPRFVKELTNLELYENSHVHFECRVEPSGDPNLSVEWYKDGVQLNSASRIALFFNFGYIGLDIKSAEVRDSGIYTCVAMNNLGEAKTECQLIVHSKGSNIIRDTNYEDSLKKIQYLEDSSKYSRKEFEEVEINEKPHFLTPLKGQEKLNEGERAHFETRLEPQNDSSMKVEWFKNDYPLEYANRISTFFNFGYVSIDIRQLDERDAGIYTCKATNKCGTDEVQVKLEIVSKRNIINDSLLENGMQKIHNLEGQVKYTREEIEDIGCVQKPFFLGPLQGPDVLYEGQTAHFETKLEPLGDSSMRIEWYFNDRLLQIGHRFRTYYDFGYVALDILYVYPEDTGKFSVRAFNKLGEAIVSKDLIVNALESIDRSQNYDIEIDKIKEMKIKKKSLENQLEQDNELTEAPKFLTQIQSQTLEELSHAHFEARLTPKSDPYLKTEWFFNNKLLEASHRYRTFHNFGFVSLDIVDLIEEDSGEYVCRATNKYGMDVTKATLKCLANKSIILEPQLPAELASTNEKIQRIEETRLQKQNTSITQDNAHIEAPLFLGPLENKPVVGEEEIAHFSTDLVPINDSELEITWFKDNEPLRNATRIKTTNDFGHITLEISPFYPVDSGIYTCKAKNKYGEAQVSSSIRCETKQSIILESQLPQNIQQTSINKIAKIEEIQQMKFYEAFTQEQQRLAQVPKFSITSEEQTIEENSNVRFESNLTPTHDQSMKIEWYHNGKPLVSSSRIKTFNDFGFVALEIRGVSERDAGIYVCRAVNQFGEAIYTTKLIVHTRKNVLLDSQLPAHFENSLSSINRFEQTTIKKTEFHVSDEIGMKPKFITQIKESVEIVEGQSFSFECDVEPAKDPELQIIWFKNGEQLRTGTRIKQIKQFGHISLQFDWTLQHDEGEYICKAVNKYGSDFTKSKIKLRTKKSIILDPQVPETISLDNLRKLENKQIIEKEIVESQIYAPKFITPIQPQHNLKEGDSAHFECRLMPTNDPKLEVIWYFNGKPLISGHRYKTQHDFGFVSLDILDVYAEDSGEYCVRAINQAGEDLTKTTLHCRAKPSLIYQTQLPNKTMELGIQRLTEMEQKTSKPEQDPDLNKKPVAPSFVNEPEAHEVYEGEPVHFSARITGNPKPKVFWVINGQTVVPSARYKITYDGIFHLDIPKAKMQDNGKIEIFGKNSAGECYHSTTLVVKPKHDDYRLVLKNSPRPWYDSKITKYQQQRKQEEVKDVFDEKLTPGGTEINRWKTEQKVDEKHVKIQEYLVDEKKEQIVQQQNLQKQINQNQPKPDVTNQRREKTFIEKSKETLDKQPKMFSQTETGVHGKQVHELVQNQIQKQNLDNLEILRKLKTTEIRELERKRLNKDIYVRQGIDEKLEAPVLTVKLEPIEVYEGDQATFECEFTGFPVPNVAWYRENFLIQNSNDFQIKTTDRTSMLTIRQVYMEDSGIFSVKIENKGGSAKSTANLVVNVHKDIGTSSNPPTFTKTITDVAIVYGELTRFDAIVVSVKPLQVYWQHNGKLLDPSISCKMLNEGNQFTLLILETNEKDLGSYECIAKNQFGEARCVANLTVHQKPKDVLNESNYSKIISKPKSPIIIESLVPIQAKEGKSATFKCRINNVKGDQVTWYKNDSPIKPSKFFRMSNDRDLFILNISEIYPEDEGVYKCVATNSSGSISSSAILKLIENQVEQQPSLNNNEIVQNEKSISNEAQQKVPQSQQQQLLQIHQQKPKKSLIQIPKIKPLVAQSALKNSNVKFETSFTGVPTPLLTWYKDKVPLKHTKDVQMLQEEGTCSLILKNVQLEHSGMYTLQGENEAGQSKTTAQLLVVNDDEELGEPIVTTTTQNLADDGKMSKSSAKKADKKKSSKKKK